MIWNPYVCRMHEYFIFNNGEVYPVAFQIYRKFINIMNEIQKYFIVYICKNLHSYSHRESTY
jgi:hypothetical protein